MKKEHVLIVEDDIFIYDNIKKALLRQNFSVDEYAPSVAKAQELIKKKQPDVALLDINLEGEEDGMFLANYISKFYDFPFIFLTSISSDHTFYEGLNAGHSAFLIKEKSDVDEIIRVIYTAINIYKSHKNTKTKSIKR